MKMMRISKQRSKACRSPDMIRIAITQAAFDAIAATLPVGCQPEQRGAARLIAARIASAPQDWKSLGRT